MTRQIELLKTEIELEGSPKTMLFDYKEELLKMASAPMPGSQGFDQSEMRQSLGICAKLKDADGAVTVEDDEWAFLNNRVKATKWTVPSQKILDFITAIDEAPKGS